MKTSTLTIAVVVFFGLGASFVSGDLGAEGVDEALEEIRPAALRGDVRFLAADALEGRGTGTRGYEIAARFVAAQMEAAGLEPAGNDGTYFQEVPLRAFKADEAGTTLTLLRPQATELAFRTDFITSGDPSRSETSVEAPVVYVGYGVTAPEQGYDDYQGIDVHGKIVALVFGAPPTFEASLRAHYSSSETKKANAVAHGAVGLIGLDDPVLEAVYSFATRVRDLSFTSFRWLDAEGNPADAHPELRGEASLSMGGVEKLLAGSGHAADELYSALEAGKPRAFSLPGTVRIHVASNLRDRKSPNVVARLTGSDPNLRNEYVVYTAHLDHLGIGEPVKGDSIYNGALDNGSGIACLIEIAKALGRLGDRPRRSILFVAVTGEEAGLRGSDYFARNPTVPRSDLVANVNMDEDLMFWPIKDMIVYGAEHSSLGGAAEEAARRLGLTLSPDPQPEQVFFVRSDQYSFVKQGIPALAGTVGQQTTDPRLDPKEIEARWIKTTYHKPQDDMTQPFDWNAAVQYARFHLLCGYLIAQDPARPHWNKGDFFGDRYGPRLP
jgi:Peptidase family M28